MFAVDAFSGAHARALARVGAASMWAAGSSAGESLLASGLFSTRRALERENLMLREELAQSRARGAGFEVLKSENESLRSLLNIVENENGLTAPVMSSFRSSLYGTFIIGAGSEDGVSGGDLVVGGEPRFGGFVVGRVDTAHARVSLVKSIFAPRETIDASVRGVGITLRGRGGGQARAEAPRDAEIEVGDAVFSPSVEGR
ncbi:MAG: rod shape-determining protein MreC, partial [Candidatus Hydrogenedentales bacterium]